ncbi:MAG: branched-chain amino acid ABC transporter permease [Thaumarchaeota archaeon]|nr:branched-chain amino acid ABC transporter permease [Nitrososphaerota archaeon]
MRIGKSIIPWIVIVAALAIYPSVAENAYFTYILILILLYSTIGFYYNLLVGYLGIAWLAPMVPYALGGFSAGYMMIAGVDPFLSIGVGIIAGALTSFAFSLLSNRLRGLYMALYSFVFVLFFQQLIIRQDVPILFKLFFGGIGMSGVPDITYGGFEWRLGDSVAYYYLAIVIAVISGLVLKKILNSKWGAAFRSIRDAEVYASTMGVSVFRMKVIAFLISSAFIATVGAVLTLFYGAIAFTVLDISNMILFLTFLVFGGLGTFFGPVVGAMILVPLNNYLTAYGAWRILLYGITILVVVLVAPTGIVGRLQEIAKRRTFPTARATD